MFQSSTLNLFSGSKLDLVGTLGVQKTRNIYEVSIQNRLVLFLSQSAKNLIQGLFCNLKAEIKKICVYKESFIRSSINIFTFGI